MLQHAEEVTGNVAQTCRYCEIFQGTYYGYGRRYLAEGLDGPYVGSLSLIRDMAAPIVGPMVAVGDSS